MKTPRARWRLRALFLSVLLLQCSSRGPAPKENRVLPPKIWACPELFTNVLNRDHFFQAFRGRAFVKTKDLNTDVEIVLWEPHYLRMEVIGALGLRMALFLINKEWVQLYLVKEKILYRLPKSEYLKSGPRREAFLRLLPFEWVPELIPGIFSTAVSLDIPSDAERGCFYSSPNNAYVIRLAGAKMGRILWLDPTTLAPLKQWVYLGSTPKPDTNLLESSLKPVWVVDYVNPKGEGWSTLRREIQLKKGANLEPLLTLKWESAETWNEAHEKIFEWKAPALSSVKEY